MPIYLIISINCILIALLVHYTTHNEFRKRLVCKQLVSLNFIILLLLAQAKSQDRILFPYLFIGMISSFIGDFALAKAKISRTNHFFRLGIGAFTITHSSQILMFAGLTSFNYWGLSFLVLINIYLSLHFRQKAQLPVRLYATLTALNLAMLLSFSLSTAAVIDSTARMLLCIGILGFIMSDFVLLHVYFDHQAPKCFKPVYLILYTFGQMLTALSIAFI
ncbi:MAG: lysoplasmalogenase family protein [Erysipelotrichaceae bacterium]|nr:lysoplasmalogenase family protein [Erysipelotrichaceae bacterium]